MCALAIELASGDHRRALIGGISRVVIARRRSLENLAQNQKVHGTSIEPRALARAFVDKASGTRNPILAEDHLGDDRLIFLRIPLVARRLRPRKPAVDLGPFVQKKGRIHARHEPEFLSRSIRSVDQMIVQHGRQLRRGKGFFPLRAVVEGRIRPAAGGDLQSLSQGGRKDTTQQQDGCRQQAMKAGAHGTVPFSIRETQRGNRFHGRCEERQRPRRPTDRRKAPFGEYKEFAAWDYTPERENASATRASSSNDAGQIRPSFRTHNNTSPSSQPRRVQARLPRRPTPFVT